MSSEPKTAADFKVVNASASDLARLNQALAYIQTHMPDHGAPIIDALASMEVEIVINYDGENKYSHSDTLRQIKWDPTTALVVVDREANILGVNSAAFTFLHEAAHAIDPNFVENKIADNDTQYGNAAERFVLELIAAAAQEAGEPIRDNHQGFEISTDNVTISAIKHNGDVIWVMKDEEMGMSTLLREGSSLFDDWTPSATSEDWTKESEKQELFSKVERPTFNLETLFASQAHVENNTSEIISYQAVLIGTPSFDLGVLV